MPIVDTPQTHPMGSGLPQLDPAHMGLLLDRRDYLLRLLAETDRHLLMEWDWLPEAVTA